MTFNGRLWNCQRIMLKSHILSSWLMWVKQSSTHGPYPLTVSIPARMANSEMATALAWLRFATSQLHPQDARCLEPHPRHIASRLAYSRRIWQRSPRLSWSVLIGVGSGWFFGKIYGGFLECGIPQNGWFARENPRPKWMMTRGTPILGNPPVGLLENRGCPSFQLNCNWECDAEPWDFGTQPVLNHPQGRLIPSGKQTVWDGKSPLLMGKSTMYSDKWPCSKAFCMFTRG